MLHELFITHCTNGTLIMNPFTFGMLYETMCVHLKLHLWEVYLWLDCVLKVVMWLTWWLSVGLSCICGEVICVYWKDCGCCFFGRTDCFCWGNDCFAHSCWTSFGGICYVSVCPWGSWALWGICRGLCNGLFYSSYSIPSLLQGSCLGDGCNCMVCIWWSGELWW